jgi:DNA-binding MarR family transcriptional regulator
VEKPFYKLDDYGSHNSLGCRLRQITSLMISQGEARFADEELTFSHWLSLTHLRDGSCSTCADLSRHMNYDSGAVTRLVDQLEQRGLVERHRSTTDRRVVNLTLTKEGDAAWKAMTPRMLDFWNSVLGGFSQAEATTLLSLLTRLLSRMESEAQKKAQTS